MFNLTTQLVQSKLFCLECMEYLTCNQITNLLEFESTTHLANKGSLQLFRWYEVVSSACDLVNDPFPQWAPSAHWVFHPPEAGKAREKKWKPPWLVATCCPWDLHRNTTHHYLIMKSCSTSFHLAGFFFSRLCCMAFLSCCVWTKLVNLQCPHLSQAFCHNSWAHGRTQGHYTTAHQSLLQWPARLVLNNITTSPSYWKLAAL